MKNEEYAEMAADYEDNPPRANEIILDPVRDRDIIEAIEGTRKNIAEGKVRRVVRRPRRERS